MNNISYIEVQTMDINGIIVMAFKCWLSWIALSQIAHHIKLTRTHILTNYPFKEGNPWKTVVMNLAFYYLLSLAICFLHVMIWNSTQFEDSGYVSHMALFVALIHGTLASYLVIRDREKEDRKSLAAVVLYWHMLCGLFLGFVIELDLAEKWLHLS